MPRTPTLNPTWDFEQTSSTQASLSGAGCAPDYSTKTPALTSSVLRAARGLPGVHRR